MVLLISGQGMGETLLPPKPGLCQECAVEHAPEMPHNQQSMYYQYKFRQQHGRWPTWADAIAHCTPEMQAAWKSELQKMGHWSEPVKHDDPVLKKGTPENTLATIEGKDRSDMSVELPPGAPVPPLMQVTTVKIEHPRRKKKPVTKKPKKPRKK